MLAGLGVLGAGEVPAVAAGAGAVPPPRHAPRPARALRPLLSWTMICHDTGQSISPWSGLVPQIG